MKNNKSQQLNLKVANYGTNQRDIKVLGIINLE